jgi:hypothetical protein
VEAIYLVIDRGNSTSFQQECNIQKFYSSDHGLEIQKKNFMQFDGRRVSRKNGVDTSSKLIRLRSLALTPL